MNGPPSSQKQVEKELKEFAKVDSELGRARGEETKRLLAEANPIDSSERCITKHKSKSIDNP
jgi:hypothetical protein